jgi:predicted AlkP superfamily phosphohydrolase/phosphomutase/tetratricopeptide (TPR) repeat protein
LATKVLLIGWDAADWKVIHPLMDRGLMPAAKRLVENGVMANLATLSPVLSPMLWTSIATGKRPYKHGILGFTEPTPDGTAVQPVTNLSRKTKAVWNILNQNGKRCHVVGWWPSHPAEPIDGVMVSNHYQRASGPLEQGWPLAKGTVHPPRLAKQLAELRFHPQELEAEHILPFVPHAAKIDQDKDQRLAMCLKVIADCTTIQSCATWLIENEPWDFMAVYFDAIDHFGHGFMKYHPPRQEFISAEDFDMYQHVVTAGYVYHDMMLGRLLELAGDETTVILMSDHGFHPDHLRPQQSHIEPAGPAVEHRDFGILAMRGPGIKRDQLIQGANLLDIAPTVLTLFDLAVGNDMDGHPLLDAFEEPRQLKTIASWDDVAGNDGQHGDDRRLDASESRQSLEQLVALGYIERPPENQEKAVAQTVRELDYNLARAYMDAGLHGEATPLLVDLYRENPLEFRFGIQLALCLRAQEMTDDLARLVEDLNARWRTGAEKARGRLKEIAQIARCRHQEMRDADSARSGDAAISLEEESDPQNILPDLFNDAERQVIRNLRAVARGNPQTLQYLDAAIALARKDYDATLEYLQNVQQSESHVPSFHLQLGEVYLRLKRYEEAQQSYEQALQLDPDNPNAHLGLSRSYAKRRRNQKALASATTAVGLKHHFPAGHYYLGLAQHRARQTEDAVKSLQLAISQNPNFAEAHLRLALIHDRSYDDKQLASEHRAIAEGIRKDQKRQRTSSILPKLPPLEPEAMDDALPEFPKPPEKNKQLRPTLSAAPRQTDPPATAPSIEKDGFVTVVSGLPRSGTSMMMQMLAAGGMSLLADGRRTADDNNPRGYFELERVKQLQTDNSWLGDARGKAIKVVAPLIPHLPQGHRYRVVFMHREADEILASQQNMLARLRREGAQLGDKQLKHLFAKQQSQAKKMLAEHGVPLLEIDYREAIEQPEEVSQRVSEFLNQDLDPIAMTDAITPALYRERR